MLIYVQTRFILKKVITLLCVFSLFLPIVSAEDSVQTASETIEKKVDADEEKQLNRLQEILESFRTDDNNNGGSLNISDLARGFIIKLAGRPWFRTKEEIDRVVGDPFTLFPETRAKLSNLPIKIRLNLYSMIASNLGVTQHMMDPHINQQNLITKVVNESNSRAYIDKVIEIAQSQFSVEELIDLGVYFLSHEANFPGSKNDWDKMKENIVNYDIWFGLGVLFTEAVIDQGVIGISGKFIHIPDEQFRMGWFVRARGLGISLEPKLKAGIKFEYKTFSGQAGASYSVKQAKSDDLAVRNERLGFHSEVINHFLKDIVKSWNLAINGRAYWDNNPITDKNTYGTSLFISKDKWFGRDGVTLYAEASIDQSMSLGLNLGVEDTRHEISGYAHIDKEKFGLYLSGQVNSKIQNVRDRYSYSASQLMLDLEKLKKEQTDYLKNRDQVRTYEELLTLVMKYQSLNLNLKNSLQSYLDLRINFYKMHKNNAYIEDESKGLISKKRLREARRRIYLTELMLLQIQKKQAVN